MAAHSHYCKLALIEPRDFMGYQDRTLAGISWVRERGTCANNRAKMSTNSELHFYISMYFLLVSTARHSNETDYFFGILLFRSDGGFLKCAVNFILFEFLSES